MSKDTIEDRADEFADTILAQDRAALRAVASPVPTRTLLTTREAASWLAFSPKTLEKWRCRGGGPAYIKLRGWSVRYKLEDLQAFADLEIRSIARSIA